MFVPCWLRLLKTRLSHPAPIRPTSRANRPARRWRLEALEDRATPSAFTVTNTTDTSNTADADYFGSLRWAITQANDTAGADTINFALPEGLKSPSGWWTIAPQTLLPALTESVIVDGWSQSGAGLGLAPRVMLDGSQVVVMGTTFGLQVWGDHCTIRGLAIGNFWSGHAIYVSAVSTTIQGCYVGVDPTGTTAVPNGSGISDAGRNTVIGGVNPRMFGGESLGEGNVVSGNNGGIGSYGYGVTIRGNFAGTDATGTVAIPNLGGGIGVGGDPAHALPSTIGGLAPGEGNLVSGNGVTGIGIDSAQHVLVVGNRIGTDVTGTYGLGNSAPVLSGVPGAGIYLRLSSDVIIGGTEPGARNVIAASGGSGIRSEGGTGIVIKGNYIGTDASGSVPLGNFRGGIMAGFSNSQIGGAEPGAGNLIFGNSSPQTIDGGVFLTASNNVVEGNVIRGNYGAGVYIGFGGQGTGNTVSGNAIYENHGLGIDLLRDNTDAGGVTLNDSLGHGGANRFQNFPNLASVTPTGGGITVTGTLSQMNTPNTNFRIEYFANAGIGDLGPDGFHYGEGQRYVGSVDVMTDASGTATISATLPALLAGEQFVTATATNLATGDTSEFSRAIARPANTPPTANAGGPYTITYGANLLLSAAASSDPDHDALTYAWTVNGHAVAASCLASEPLTLTLLGQAHQAGDRQRIPARVLGDEPLQLGGGDARDPLGGVRLALGDAEVRQHWFLARTGGMTVPAIRLSAPGFRNVLQQLPQSVDGPNLDF
jgi:hypothetical protein